MSAILEALRRIEREPQETRLQSSPQQLDPMKSLGKRLRKRWFRKRMITLFFVLAILGGTTWAAIQYKPWVTPKATVATINSASNKGKTKPAIVAPKRRSDYPPSLASGERRPRQAELPRPKIREEQGFLPGVERFGKSSPSETKHEKQETPPAIETKRAPSAFPGDSEFKLDALVWSSNPKSRFAVINGRIVRAGETVKGASITEIQRDYVALKAGNRTWELRLNIQLRSP